MDRSGNSIQLFHSVGGQLLAVVDTLGRTNTVAYDALGRVASVTDFSGRAVVYTYYGAGEPDGIPRRPADSAARRRNLAAG